MDKITLLNYYNEFIIKQDYFECHEIMEDSWKSKENFTKNLDEVFFIQVSTAEYHYRRNNLYGAKKIYNRAVDRLNSRPIDYNEYGLKSTIKNIIGNRLHNIDYVNFKPLQLPLTDDMYRKLHSFAMPDVSYEEFLEYIKNLHKTSIMLVEKHRLRDRSEIINVRNANRLKKRRKD
ncbi:DUF309 domain-containing protein [Lacicoccus qingdaonensis]|uniref:DUF309 domain-containing protein n=1 Tax=Lacicoccus qingdaonensis TaxID=576118 RepID=A0A1G9CP03_9BACL|nr:DUF309 domain-containing protein [Salinicoccus qingdaonensis]SDK53175.1 hypothetical protein SAMN05216216_104129 [Salinicoccus qingdaonensis]